MRIVLAFALAGATLAQALVGDWTSYTKVSDIRDLKEAKGYLFCATGGGIRKVHPETKAEVLYRNREGLRDVAINALAVSPEGRVFAASEAGFLYGYDPAAEDWDILSAAYKGAGWTMNRRAMVYRGGYLILGSAKGLSFFNVGKRIDEANVTKMGPATGISVNSILFAGDTLFAGTDKGIFRAVLRLDRLLTDAQVNIFNPAIWTLVPGTQNVLFFDPEHPPAPPTPPDPEPPPDPDPPPDPEPPPDPDPDPGDTLTELRLDADTARHLPDETEIKFAHGMLYYGPMGIASEYEGVALARPAARISRYRSEFLVEGKVFPNGFFLETVASAGGRWFLGGAEGLLEFRPEGEAGLYAVLSNPENLPFREITAIRANASGVYLWATPMVYRLNGKIWDSVADMRVASDVADVKRRGLHTFEVPALGRFYVGTWGGGFVINQGGVRKVFDATTSCLESAVEPSKNPNFPVIWARIPYKDKGLWLSSEVDAKTYQVAYYDYAKGTLACFRPDTRDREPRSLDVVGDSVLAVVSERGLSAYRIADDGSTVTLEPRNLLANLPFAPEPTLAGKADKAGNFWVTTEGSRLLYVPGIIFSETARPIFQSLDGFSGTACKSFESDPQGHLWAGCSEGGVFEILPGKDSLSHSFRKYGLNDGLVSEVIFHLDVNPANGDVWVVTERGLSRYESPSRPVHQGLAETQVYPNPFLAKHQGVVFDKLPTGSEIQVSTQSGSVVYHKSLAPGTGDQIVWNGRNQAGERVREGVYFYVIRSPKKSKNGKIIVAR